jgi:beta-phosphoglucomutase-like phosphatase (HAD superfamily)
MSELVVSDAAFADADAVWTAAMAHLAAKYAAIRPLAPGDLPPTRAEAITALDAWAGDGSWRAEVVRFYEASAPVLLRPDPELNGLLRRARRAGRRLTIVSPLPRAAAELYLAHLGVRRMADSVLGEEDAAPAPAVATRAELVAALS